MEQCSLGILEPGDYSLKLKVRKGTGADGALTFGIHDNAAQRWTEWAIDIDMTAVSTEGWTEVTTSFTVASNDGTATVSTTADYANLDITYTCGGNPNINNYVLIDDIQILNSTGVTVDTIEHGDFDTWLTTKPHDLLQTVGWRTDNTGQDVVYATEKYYENELLVENNGNKCFKFFSSSQSSTTSDFAGNIAIAEAGVYKMVIKAKVGAGAITKDANGKAASVITNIGFRFYVTGKASLLGTEQTTGSDGVVTTVSKSKQINSVGYKRLQTDEWVTLIAYFKVPETYTTNYCNINFYVFGNNNTVQKADNYLLIDDVAIHPVTPK